MNSNSKLYQKDGQRKICIVIIICLVFLYLIFFTSKLFFPISENKEITEIGKEYEFYEGEKVTLLSAEYSKEQKRIRVIMEFKKEELLKNSEYEFYSLLKSSLPFQKPNTEKKIENSLLTVVEINEVINFQQIILQFAANQKNKDEMREHMGEIILDKGNIKFVKKLKAKGEEEYLAERLLQEVALLKKGLMKVAKKVEELEKKLSNYQDEIYKIEESKSYMSVFEVEEADLQIERYQLEREELLESKRKEEEKYRQLKLKIEETEIREKYN
ncbi:MAG: hypothetical protein ACRCUS_02395 [Anaerovoracaceae bacterium]